MASVYILYSKNADRYYIGSCKELEERLHQHREKIFDGFTADMDDWELYYSINELNYQEARAIEAHIKKMKSRKYLENLRIYPDITHKLIHKYRTGSSR
ncbi:MAG: catalytic domain protein [Bacteroidetes bacterium]|nr:catalytic domain protein [Bacteroidota bacterium]